MNKIPLQQLNGCINTASGQKINLLDPKPGQVNIHDIARGLSYNSHFGGQTPLFFSIAQHCLLVCELMEEAHHRPDLLMTGLLHDASEAYLGDIIKPLKVHLPEYVAIEERMMGVILNKYNLVPSGMALVKEYDIRAQELEYEAFYKKGRISYYTPEQSRTEFMRKFYTYLNQRHLQEHCQ